MDTTQKLSKAQTTSLGTIIAKGGEMNGYAGQRGFYCNSMDALAKKGLVEKLGFCACYHGGECDKNHTTLEGQKNGASFYNRVRITDAGRVAHSDAVAGGAPVETKTKKTPKKVAPVVIAVESGDKVTKGGVKGRVLEVCTRAGVMLAAVAFGFDLVWVKVAELVAL